LRAAADIAVAGAGIGGLAAALALAETGARVTVYERAEALEPVGAGVQLSPNAALVLRRLGVLDALRARATEPAEVLIRRGRDGAALARVPLADAETRYGAPFLVTLRADLQAALLARAVAHPAVTLVFGRGVSGYDRTAGGVLLRFGPEGPPPAAHGAAVAADGIRSAIRRQMSGPARDDAAAFGRTAWRALVPGTAAEADALVARSNLWLGPRAHLVHYPVGAGAVVNLVAIVDDGAAPDDPAAWSVPGDAPELERRFAGWALPARRLLAAAPAWRKWPLFDRPPLARWCDGPVALLGDAAHPMLPFLAQGAAQAIEDAAALADAVSRSPGDLGAAMAAYAAARGPRTARVQAESRRQARVYHLAPPASLMRDFVLSRVGPDRLVARFDWLYDAPDDVRRFAAS
jgi:salicylate hydroxylase